MRLNTEVGREIFINLCRQINDYASEHFPEIKRTVEEIEATAFAALSAAAETVGSSEARNHFELRARERLSVPKDSRKPC
jgi:hypothetical protein